MPAAGEGGGRRQCSLSSHGQLMHWADRPVLSLPSVQPRPHLPYSLAASDGSNCRPFCRAIVVAKSAFHFFRLHSAWREASGWLAGWQQHSAHSMDVRLRHGATCLAAG